MNQILNRMETKKCPFCGEEILAEAKKCKHCGEWLDKREETILSENKMKDDDRSSNGWTHLIEGILFFAIGIGVYFFVSNKIEERNKQKRDLLQERKEQWEQHRKESDQRLKQYTGAMRKLQEDYNRERRNW